MIVNPTDGQKYLVTSNMGRNVLKKYLTAYKNGGSSPSSDDFDDEFSDDNDEEIPFLSPEDIELRINTLRESIPETDAVLQTYITDIDNHIKQLMRDIISILVKISEKDDEISMLKRIIEISPAAG